MDLYCFIPIIGPTWAYTGSYAFPRIRIGILILSKTHVWLQFVPYFDNSDLGYIDFILIGGFRADRMLIPFDTR